MRTKIAATLAGFAAILVVGGVAYASIPGPDGVINGCRKNSTGDMRVIDSTATCPSGWTALNWRDTGPVPLADRASTADTLTGLQNVSSQGVLTFPAGDYNGTTVACPPGQFAVGGGASVTLPSAAPAIVLVSSYPFNANPSIGWQGIWRNVGTTDVEASVTIHAICAGEVS